MSRGSARTHASFATSSSSQTSITIGSEASSSHASTSTSSGATGSYASSLESHERGPQEYRTAPPGKCRSRRDATHEEHHPSRRNESAADDYDTRPQHREAWQPSYTFEPQYGTREPPIFRPQNLTRAADGTTAWPMEPPPVHASQPSWSSHPSNHNLNYRNAFECREPGAFTQSYAAPPHGVPPSCAPLQTYGRPSHRGGFAHRSPYFSHS